MRIRRIIAGLASAALLAGCGDYGGTFVIGRGPVDAGALRPRDATVPPPLRDAGFSRDGDIDDSGPALPDLELERLGPAPVSLAPSDTFEVEFAVWCAGRRGTSPSIVRFELTRRDRPLEDPIELGVVPVPALASDARFFGTAILTIPALAETASYRLSATLDPDDNLVESDESNNRREQSVLYVSPVTVTPASFDFGVVGVNCRVEEPLRLDNRGNATAYVWELGLFNPGVSTFAISTFSLPRTIGPGESFSVDVAFEPRAVGYARGSLRIAHDQLLGTMTLPLAGAGEVDPIREERFRQLAHPRLDILLVIDDSGSMEEEQQNLATRAGVFLGHLKNRDVDYHVAVTTTDVSSTGAQGALLGTPKIITRTTPNAERAFATTVMLGNAGSDDERGLEAARRALSEPLINGENAGFVRADASLALIFVSDEDDASPEPVVDYQRFFSDLKAPGGDGRFVANAIVAPSGGCATASAPGARYSALVAATGGVSESICDFDWTTALRTFPGPGFGFLNSVPLSRRPDVGAIEIFVDGALLREREPVSGRRNWLHDSARNVIVFDTFAVPEPSAEIVVRFRTRC